MVRRAVDIHYHLGPRKSLRPRGVARVPDVLAHVHAHAHAGHRIRRTALAGLEVAHLVEHAVVGEPLLVVDIRQAAVVDHRRRVVDVAVAALPAAGQVHEAHHRRDAAAALDHGLQRLQVVPHEGRAQQKVLRRVARHR